jgi:hypothetical protein
VVPLPRGSRRRPGYSSRRARSRRIYRSRRSDSRADCCCGSIGPAPRWRGRNRPCLAPTLRVRSGSLAIAAQLLDDTGPLTLGTASRRLFLSPRKCGERGFCGFAIYFGRSIFPF